MKNQLFNHDDNIQIEQFPVVCKDEIMKEQSLFSAEYTFGRNDELTKVRTSGSTGKCMEIIWDRKDDSKSMLPLWIARLKYYGIRMDARYCYFYTSLNENGISNEDYYQYTKNSLGFSKCNLTNERLQEIYELIVEYKPIWMGLQPSVALLLANHIKKNTLPAIDSLKYIELTGEMLSKSVRYEIENVFTCKVANQYGCYEANSIAYECPEGNLHCLENTYTEITDETGKNLGYDVEGDITITTLESHVMPFIRYKTGDRGILCDCKKCKCGNKNPIIKLTTGRVSDYVIMEDGKKINSYVFVNAVKIVNDYYNMIIQQFQIIQMEYQKFMVKLVLNEEIIDSGVHESMVEELFLNSINEDRIKTAEYEFDYYDELLPDEYSGKLRYFKREF